MRFTLYLLILLFSAAAFGQKKYPKDVFRAPLDIPTVLAGTFGELRSDHFHSGVDIKTQQREGLAVKSIGPGYISRIKISHWGFGKALYVTHPNGYTSVYAHLQKFSPEIEAYIKKKQYAKKSYTIQTYPEKGALNLKKGDIIAYSGNTGGSSGPHLHFEIRKTGNSNPINPLFFGIDVEDDKRPVVKSVFAYSLNETSQVNQSNKPIQLNLRESSEGTFVAERIFAHGKIGFGVNTVDRQNLAYNNNGIYKVETLVNGIPYFNYDFETFSFGETRFINTLIDYTRYKLHKERIQRLFKTPANELSIYNKAIDNGIINVKDSSTYNIKIKIKDIKDNTTTIYIPVTGRKQPILIADTIRKTPYRIKANERNIFKDSSVTINFSKNTFYKDFYLDFKSENDTTTLHTPIEAVHKNFSVLFDVKDIPKEEREQLFIASLSKSGIPIYHGTVKEENTFRTRTKTLGKYFLAKDTVPPTILADNFKDEQWLTNFKYLKVKIGDDVSGIKSYKGTIDGQWVLFEYEPKKSMLSFNFNDITLATTKKAKHKLKIVVTDNVGNNTTFESTFYRKK
ncbi:M23 family metallopeptidase [Spongiivirga citrea]|uniref:Peptidoglycan DD-metalloendopeptidase family protein n=1 Tax=Spongiivirga citrea TaxID=1481457 RepID=A0A6M0CJU1_9FLAO|nr:M23 family metallopeptidase [Spongiivirga citrea]NER15707.1 peptidoglycan DD-metalloendopeptidase family protein [Spongiivirga citrea]